MLHMPNFLHYSNWSKLIKTDGDHINYLEQKRNVLFSQFCIIAAISAVIQAVYDLVDGYPFVMAMDLLIAGVLVTGYLLNEKRKHTLAKLLVLISSNFLLFSFAAVVPKGVGMYLLFYPLVAFSFIALDFKHRKYSYGLAIVALILNGILVLTDFQPYGSINLQPSDPTISFALNLMISIVLLSLGIDFLLKINHRAEMKLMENQKHTEKLAREINDKNLSLEKTNQELDRFVYSTSHDLRAPLASILGLINLTELEKDTIPPLVVDYLEMMKDRVNSLDDFIKDIIDYSRNSRMEVVLTDVDLVKLVEEVIMNNRFLKKADKVKVTAKIDINKALKLDRNRVFRVLNNLVSNAIKYNDITKENPIVKISASVEHQTLFIEIADSGKGIREEIQDKVFDMFYRGTDNGEGSGLGLYIAREMVQKMNGTLTFSSHLGKGTTFKLVIPLTTPDL
jgi:signal transduction histidine kinase